VPGILKREKRLLDQVTVLQATYEYSVNLDTCNCGLMGKRAVPTSAKKSQSEARRRHGWTAGM
jgi:hypothetical protein